MGRKIPAKRHRGVKNPLEQQARREKSLKCKINAPPKDPDEQPIPHSLIRLFNFQNKQNNKQQKKNNNKRSKVGEDVTRNIDNPVSRLRRLPGESGRSFSLRINSAVRALHTDVEPSHYPEEFEKEDVKGERIAARVERKRRRAAATACRPAASLTRSQKLALKKKDKREKAAVSAAEAAEVVHEHVAFGEVASAPPAWRGAERPARRPLLLSALLGGAAPAPARDAAVAAYRDLKRRRRLTTLPLPASASTKT